MVKIEPETTTKSVKSRLLEQIRTFCGSRAACENDFLKLVEKIEKEKINFLK